MNEMIKIPQKPIISEIHKVSPILRKKQLFDHWVKLYLV